MTAPVTVTEVETMLSLVPPEFLAGLRIVYLLGGTAKQDKVAFSSLFRYGCYWNCKIVLHAFPRRLLSQYYSRLPSPAVMHEYERAGATWTRDGDEWLFTFPEGSLSAFYLYDVLLHEIGHHVDRFDVSGHDRSAAERYAKWFATFCGQRIASE